MLDHTRLAFDLEANTGAYSVPIACYGGEEHKGTARAGRKAANLDVYRLRRVMEPHEASAQELSQLVSYIYLILAMLSPWWCLSLTNVGVKLAKAQALLALGEVCAQCRVSQLKVGCLHR